MTPIRKLGDSHSNGASVSEVRKRYLDFFAKRGHAVIPSAPIVPENDPTTLFTSSGMQPLVSYLLGQPHPQGNRLANSQLSFRSQDIEEVGDNRHTTFFEMLGNWSLGDYFKAEQLPWLYEFLTEELNLPKEKIWVTCFEGDEKFNLPRDNESADIWKKIGVPEDHIHFYGSDKNWWSRSGTPDKMPVGEPGGPDSEVFYDFGSPCGEKCHPNCDCGRFMEIGNSVFMEYVKNADGSFDRLPQRNVDFGGGLERLTAATMGNSDIFLIDVFDEARAVLEKQSGKKYDDASSIRSFRIILDHMRAATFMIASGIHPSNTEQGYILRRLVRRAIREADKIGIKEAVLAEVAGSFVAVYADAYPFIQESAHTVREELEKEETQFKKTLAQGMREFERISTARINGVQLVKDLDSDAVFELVTSHGFPFEMVKEIAQEQGLSVDELAFERDMKKHQALSRAGAAQRFAGGLADSSEQTVKYHTAHHLLLKALQMVLGKDVHQRGSNITSERLRIDFSYGTKMTPEQIAEVEKIVNDQIKKGLPVEQVMIPREEAENLGAEHEFGAKYPDTVSVYFIGGRENAFSIEFCGGPHVANTRELTSVRDPDGSDRKGPFKIIKEEASSAGVRRIKAILDK